VKTITILVGNSDDKLTQFEWSKFVRRLTRSITHYSTEIFFHATSEGSQPWQNACWTILATKHEAAKLRSAIVRLRKEYRQDSAAWIEGEASFI
jgi:hypothetical protein